MIEHQSWVTSALCRQVDPDLHFGGPDGDSHSSLDEVARRICRRCSVQLQCLDLVLHLERTVGEQFGVWGGYSAKERRRLARRAVA